MSRRATSWLTTPVFGVSDIGPGDVVVAVVLSAFAFGSASGLTHAREANTSYAAACAVLLMTAPVAFARRYPLIAASTLAAGAALNWLLIGHLIRCGAALPAAFYVAFAVGSRSNGWRRAGIGWSLVAVDIVCQAYSDPRLGVGVIPYMVPMAAGFLVVGRMLQSRNAAVESLRDRTAELRAQREQTTRLAVAADQARIAEDLDGFLHGQVGQIAAVAAAGRNTLDADVDAARDAFVAIQGTGRETLTRMRSVVASLRDPAPTEPQPVLAQLDRLLDRAGADAHLRVSGDPRLLPPGLELSGYRIIEHLLLALEQGPSSRVDVAVAFGSDSLELTVVGRSARGNSVRPALAAATERAAVHGGTLHTEASGGRRTTVVTLPLAAGHA